MADITGPADHEKLLALAKLARRMRNCQKAYARTRTPQALAESTNMARHLDDAVAAILDEKAPELWDKL